MKRFFIILSVIITILGIITNSQAFFIDFENGQNLGRINDIQGISFKNFNGYDAIYGDSGTGNYETYSDNLNLAWNNEWFHHNGFMWLWAGKDADARGVIVDFENNDGTWFKTGYSSYGSFLLDVYFTDGSTTTVSGTTNTNMPMSFLAINARPGTYIDYIVLSGSKGNIWLADDMSGDTSGIHIVNGSTIVPEPSTAILFLAAIICFAVRSSCGDRTLS